MQEHNVLRKHVCDAKRESARSGCAGPHAVDHCLASDEPGDRDDALRVTRIAGLRSLRPSSRLWAVPGGTALHHPASTPHRVRMSLEWSATTTPWLDYRAMPGSLSNPARPRCRRMGSAEGSRSDHQPTRLTPRGYAHPPARGILRNTVDRSPLRPPKDEPVRVDITSNSHAPQ